MAPAQPPAPTQDESAARFLTTVRDDGLVAIVRGHDPLWAAQVGSILMAAGVRVLEVTLTTPSATQAISALRSEAPPDTWVGAGTVLSADDADRCRDAGAMFTVTPGWCEAVSRSVSLGLPVLAGAWTPSEVYAAHQAGATAVKVFPIISGGAGHLRALRDPLPHVPLVAVGGVQLDDVAQLRAAGAIAVGAGASLCGASTERVRADNLTRRAQRYLEASRS